MKKKIQNGIFAVGVVATLALGFPMWGRMLLWREVAKPQALPPAQVPTLMAAARFDTHSDDAPLPPISPPHGTRAVILAAHGMKKNPASPLAVGAPAGDDLIVTVNRLSRQLENALSKIEDFDMGAMTLHLLKKPRKIRSVFLLRKGYRYQSGLTALLRCRKGSCAALPGAFIHSKSLSFKSAQKRLKKGRGVEVPGLDLADGDYTALDESFLVAPPDGESKRLYRASTLLDEVSAGEIISACVLAGDYLLRMQRPDGRWFYEYDSGRDRLNKRNYNTLRHAGTTYSLFQLYRRTREPRHARSAKKGLEWLKTTIEADPRDPKRFYVREGRNIKLGGAGLGLMALVEKEKALRATSDEKKIMKGLARHMVLAQNEDGSFESYHSVPGIKAKKRRSIYYPGEAMLGLIRYYQRHPECVECLETVKKAADYLIDRRWNLLGLRFNIPPDAWLMLALEELHQVAPEQKYADYAFAIARGMGFEQWIRIYPQADFAGGYSAPPPQVTPAGARLEGLTAAWIIAQRLGDADTMAYLEKVIRRSIAFQISRLIRPEFVALYPAPSRALGAFRHSPVSNRTRIDYNQHNISGLLVAAEIFDTSFP